MIRLLTYGVKMMKRYNSHKSKKKEYDALYFREDPIVLDQKIKTLDVVGIIIPFLYDETAIEIEKQINTLLEKNSNVQIFVISIFASIDVMTRLTMSYNNIYVINILCIVKMKSLLAMLQENCKAKPFDFTGNQDFIDLILESSKKELARKSDFNG